MSNSELSIQELVGRVESGDETVRADLENRVDAMLDGLATKARPAIRLRAMSVASGREEPSGDGFDFSSPCFNSVLLKSLGKRMKGQPRTKGEKGVRVLRAAPVRDDSSQGLRRLFSRMLAENRDSHLSVICHLATESSDDGVFDLVKDSVALGEFDEASYCDWFAGVGELLGLEGCSPVPGEDGFFGDAWNTLSEGAKKVGQAIVAHLPTIDDFVKLASSAQEMARMLLDKVVDAAADVAGLLRNAFDRGLAFLRDLLVSFVRAGTDIGKLFRYFVGLASDKFGLFVDALASISSDLAGQVVAWFVNAADSAMELARQVYEAMINAGRSFVDFLKYLVDSPVLSELVQGIISFSQRLRSEIDKAAEFLVDLMVKAFRAHVHLFRSFAQGLERLASGGKTSIKPSDAAGMAAIVGAVIGIFFASSFPTFTLSVLLLVFAPMLVGVVVGIFASKVEKPSRTFDLSQIPSSRISVGDATRKYVIFSDLHRGTQEDANLGISYTGWNKDLYANVLDAYERAGYVLVENGDAEDFWNDSTAVMGIASGRQELPEASWLRKEVVLLGIEALHARTYDVLGRFANSGRLVKVLGNHDMDLDGMDYSLSGRKVPLWDALRIPVRQAEAPTEAPASSGVASDLFSSRVANQSVLGAIDTYVLHGHQVDDANSQKSSTLGRAVTCLGVIGSMLAKQAGSAAKLFGDMGLEEIRALIDRGVQSYMIFAGPLEQKVWTNQMTSKHFVVGSDNPKAKADYEVPEQPQSGMESIGIDCLSEVPMVRIAKIRNCNIVMGHTHNTKAFTIEGHPSNGILANSGTGGMFEKVVSCLEIVGNQIRVVYHVASSADPATKSVVAALSL